MDRDGLLELTISEDGMTALGSFLPPVGEGRMLSPDYVDTVLESRGVVYGIDHEAIAEAVFTVNTDHHAREGVVLARGTAPLSARPSFFRILSQTQHSGEFSHHTDRIDYKEVSRLPVVHPGQVIAVKVDAVEGQAGTTVRGEEVPFQTQTIQQLVPGNHVRVVEHRAVAEIGGQLQVRDGAFHVEDRLEITGSVGYETGSIEFPGDVVLRGEVKDGFHIWAGRSVTAAGTVDVSEVYCRGDFSSTGGVVGRGKAILRSGGKVQARFISNCFVESKESVFIKQYAYQSHIGCQDRLATGNHGRIMGGVVTAANGLRCQILGNDAAAPTHARVGIDFIAERKLRLITEKYQAVSVKLQKLTAAAGDDPSDRQVDIIHHLEDRRNRLAMRMGEVAGALDANEEAEVVVDGDVFPGVQVQICRSTFAVTEQAHAVRFHLEKESGRVVMEAQKTE